MATTLSYNGVQFDDITCTTFSQKPILTDDGVQKLYDEITIGIKAYFNVSLHPATEVPNYPSTEESPPQTWNRVVTCLTTLRKTLIFGQDGIDLINQVGADPKAGPYPKVIAAKQLTSSTWEVDFEVTTYIANCCGTQKQPPALLANRWTESVSIDQDGFSTISRKGRAYFRYDIASAFGVDSFRQQVWASCPLKPGFLRSPIDVVVQSDGMAFDYTITDHEVFAMPYPIVGISRASASWKLSTQKGAIYQQDISISVSGFKTCPRSRLFAAAGRILAAIQGANLNGVVLFNGSYEIPDLYNGNTVHCSCTILKSAKRQALQRLQTMSNVARVGPWAGKDTQIPDPGSRGSARVQLITSLIGDPCDQQTLVMATPAAGFDRQVQGGTSYTT